MQVVGVLLLVLEPDLGVTVHKQVAFHLLCLLPQHKVGQLTECFHFLLFDGVLFLTHLGKGGDVSQCFYNRIFILMNAVME
jgi:hypothetical protein